MKKIFWVLLAISFSLNIFSQDIIKSTEKDVTGDESDSEKIVKIEKEIDAIKKDVSELKDKTSWFSFKFEGSTKTTFGVALYTPDGYKFNSSTPITSGFDFDNRIRFSMKLADKVIASSRSESDDGTEVSIKMKIQSLGLTETEPEGSYYIISATTDTGKKVNVYYPRETGSSNILFGNFSFAFEEAKVKNIVGTGAFINYNDVMSVQQYFGVVNFVDVLTLNHSYFNNGFASSDSVLYYSYNPEYYNATSKSTTTYEPKMADFTNDNEIPDAVKFWNDNELYDSTRTGQSQNPHGISGGYDGDVSEGVHVYVEGGLASKDAFDPKYYEDYSIDLGFFLKGGANFYSSKFAVYPKAAFSFAFQTDTSDDVNVSSYYYTFGCALSLPIEINLPTGKNDKVRLETNWNMVTHIQYSSFASILSVNPEFILLNQKLSFALPFIYSYKYNQSGFVRVGNENLFWLTQDLDDHMINLGFTTKFDSTNLFGDLFQFITTNRFYFTNNYIYSSGKPETFIYEIIRFDWILHDIGPSKMDMFFEFGYGAARDARLVDENCYVSSTSTIYYDNSAGKWYDSSTGKEVYTGTMSRWSGNVISIQTGFNIDIIKNLSVGFSAESPKLLLGDTNAIGDQHSFGTFKLWSEIKF